MLCIIMARRTVVLSHGEVISDGEHEEYEWHIGEQVPDVPVGKISEIQADGSELGYIEDIFSLLGGRGHSIPMPRKKRVVRWYGDIARTIYLNL